MRGNAIILISIIICVVALLWEIYEDKLSKLVLRILMGAVVITVVNLILPQYAVGINLITLGCSGILGLPGVVTLYMIMLL